MRREGMTVRDATEEWVREMNAFPYDMIDKLMAAAPDEWTELTVPATGDRVYVFDVPGNTNYGEIVGYDEESELYCVELDDGKKVSVSRDDFEDTRDSHLPMWGWLWQFGDSADDYWLEELDGIRIMSECGFRIYEHEEWGYFFGIDGAGYDFYEAHWEPLYRARGLQWHDPKAEHERQMRRKGYTKGKLGNAEVWLDDENRVVEEVR